MPEQTASGSPFTSACRAGDFLNAAEHCSCVTELRFHLDTIISNARGPRNAPHRRAATEKDVGDQSEDRLPWLPVSISDSSIVSVIVIIVMILFCRKPENKPFAIRWFRVEQLPVSLGRNPEHVDENLCSLLLLFHSQDDPANLDSAVSLYMSEESHTLDRWPSNQIQTIDAFLETWLSHKKNIAERKGKRWHLEQVLAARPGPWYSEFGGMGHVPVWLIPAGWEALEAIEWRNSLLDSNPPETDLAETNYRFRVQIEPYHPNNDIRVASVLCLRIRRIAELQGIEPQPTRLSLHLWIRLRELLSSTIQKLSPQITDTENVFRNIVLQKICELSVIEVYLNLGGARAHFRGFLAILRVFGSPIELAQRESKLGIAIQVMAESAILSNTLTNRGANIREVYAFSDQELVDVYRLAICNEFPCPSFLWDQIIKISRLRSTIASRYGGGQVKQEVMSIFQQIASFAPESWQEPYDIPKGHVALLLASMFKSAVIIYCCASVPIPPNDEEYAAWSLRIISGQRRLLLSLVSEVMELGEKVIWTAIWPLGVVGCAASKGTYSERALITHMLNNTSYQGNPTTSALLRQLNNFWLYPGEGKWDDCWGDSVIFPVLPQTSAKIRIDKVDKMATHLTTTGTIATTTTKHNSSPNHTRAGFTVKTSTENLVDVATDSTKQQGPALMPEQIRALVINAFDSASSQFHAPNIHVRDIRINPHAATPRESQGGKTQCNAPLL
ncbi:hypothetical protein PWT90_07315 [Aphanocladium album]|nr:hypothetical protein PWT90_07315 [Aphanocladium album]